MWVGSQAHALLVQSAGVAATQMRTYDSLVPLALEAVDEGDEPAALVDALRVEASSHRTPRSGRSAAGPTFRASYNQDFDTLEAAARAAEDAGPVPWNAQSVGAGSGAAQVWGPARRCSETDVRGGAALGPQIASGRRRGEGLGGVSGAQTWRGAGGMGGTIPPVVPPLQLNTFVSPPPTTRVRAS